MMAESAFLGQNAPAVLALACSRPLGTEGGLADVSVSRQYQHDKPAIGWMSANGEVLP